MIDHEEYEAILKPENERTEHAVFKIHQASKNQVWEINFLLSCFKMLAKFLIHLQEPSFPGVNRFNEKRALINKMIAVRNCVKELDDFVSNKNYNTSIEQIFGQINPAKQKLLREQYYIDIVIKILERIVIKGELELW